jgi:Asparaginase
MHRRDFFRLSALGLPVLIAGQADGQASSSSKFKLPVAISTWDSGLHANAAAWPILSKGGLAIDAVEAAGRAVEDEPSCCVGLAAYPDRDGKVTLDSCIMDGRGNCGAVSFVDRIQTPCFACSQSYGSYAARYAVRRRR